MGSARADGMSWSPDGKVLTFFAEIDQATTFYCVSGYLPHEISRADIRSKAWSPNSRYLAFVEKGDNDWQLKCMPKDRDMSSWKEETWAKEQIFDLSAPTGRTIGDLQWSPDSGKLLASAYAEQPGSIEGWDEVSSPALFLTWPGAESPTVMWQDEKRKNRFPQAQWADGGKAVVFALVAHAPAYDIPQSLHVINVDGSNLHTVWNEDFIHFELSPDGSRALLWVLGEGWGDAPEPRRMAAVNLLTGETKWFEEGMVALEPGSVISGRDTNGPRIQKMEWSGDGSSVTLLVHDMLDGRNWRRVMLELP